MSGISNDTDDDEQKGHEKSTIKWQMRYSQLAHSLGHVV